jgi:RNA polymerase sigma-70 factor (ECF subfamily)
MMSLWSRKTELAIQTLSSYLATAVRFAVFKAITRDKRRRELLQQQAMPEATTDTLEKLDAVFLREQIQGAIEQLPEKPKLIFAYRRDEELTISQIAKKMDLSPKAVQYHITKTLRTLRDAVKKIKLIFV